MCDDRLARRRPSRATSRRYGCRLSNVAVSVLVAVPSPVLDEREEVEVHDPHVRHHRGARPRVPRPRRQNRQRRVVHRAPRVRHVRARRAIATKRRRRHRVTPTVSARAPVPSPSRRRSRRRPRSMSIVVHRRPSPPSVFVPRRERFRGSGVRRPPRESPRERIRGRNASVAFSLAIASARACCAMS